MLKNRNLILATGFVLMMMYGLVYAWSLFITPIEAELGWNRADTSLIFSISMFSFCIGSIVSGTLNPKMNGRYLFLIGAGILFAGFLGSSRVTGLLQIYISYGVLCGFGCGLCYNTLIALVIPYFKDAVGLASGVLMMGFGLGSFILGTVATMVMNSAGWRKAFLLFAFMFSIGSALGCLLINRKATDQTENSVSLEGMTSAEMLRMPIFFKTYAFSVLLVSMGMVIINHVNPSIMAIGASSTTALMAVSCVSITNGAARIIFGRLYDKKGLVSTLKIVIACGFISPLLLSGATFIRSIVLSFIGYIFMALSYGGLAPANSVIARSLYGEKNYSQNLSIVSSTGIPGSFIGPYAAGVLLTHFNSYLPIYMIMIVVEMVVVLLGMNVLKDMKVCLEK